MKKLVLLLAVVCSVSLFSCGNKAAEATEATDNAVEATVAEGDAVVAEGACCEQPTCPGDSCNQDSTNCNACCAAEVVEVAETPAE